MSMLSAQCDKLRSMAKSVGLEVPQAATLMMEAADTIWELRGSVYRERAEADRLREQNHWLKQGDILHVLTDQEYSDQCERERLMQVSIDALDKENAKLRELVRDMYMRFHGVVIENWAYSSEDFRMYEQRMRELGVEVEL